MGAEGSEIRDLGVVFEVLSAAKSAAVKANKYIVVWRRSGAGCSL